MDYIASFAIGVVAGVLSCLAAEFGIIRHIDARRANKSDYSGKWRQRIYEDNDFEYAGEVIKEDVYNLQCYESNRFFTNKYINGMNINIRGTIEREVPPNQQRKWRFIGYIADDVITILYEPINKRQKSRGCIYLKKVRDEISANDFFRGYYLEQHDDKGNIDKIPLTLTKEEG